MLGFAPSPAPAGRFKAAQQTPTGFGGRGFLRLPPISDRFIFGAAAAAIDRQPDNTLESIRVPLAACQPVNSRGSHIGGRAASGTPFSVLRQSLIPHPLAASRVGCHKPHKAAWHSVPVSVDERQIIG